jgi:uncharacterized protein YndB with AHSA1/START domain
MLNNRADDPHTIVSARMLGATRARVFEAFQDPKRLERWWGPKGFTNSFHEFDPRPGGAWRFAMRGPDGAVYEMVKEFIEFVPLQRIVLRHPDPTHCFTMAMTFAAIDAQTTSLDWRMRFDDEAEAVRVRPFVVTANEENFDRLAAHLAST